MLCLHLPFTLKSRKNQMIRLKQPLHWLASILPSIPLGTLIFTVIGCRTFRRIILKELAACTPTQYLEELSWTRAACQRTPKSFQVWYHRQEIFAICADGELQHLLSDELADLDENIFTLDAKNYHAWSYRIWLTKRYAASDTLKNELETTNRLIQDNPFNNSAWNYRYFLYVQLNVQQEDIASDEIR